MNAYGSYLMKRQYPFYVLSVWVPQDEVDVNVHPNKTDVRFSNNQVIYGTIYSVVSKVLDGLSEALEIIKEPVVSQSENFLNQEKGDIISNEKGIILSRIINRLSPRSAITLQYLRQKQKGQTNGYF